MFYLIINDDIMLSINKIFSNLTVLEKKNFRKFIADNNKRKDVKNIEYFDLLISENYSEQEIKILLYPNGNFGAYHGLRKRFIDAFVLFMTEQYVEINSINSEMEISKLIMVSKNQLKQKQYELGFLLLNKAEKKSLNSGNYGLLHQIYHLKIQYAHKSDKIDLDQIMDLFKINQEHMMQEEKLNMAYAVVNKKYREMLYENKIQPIDSLMKHVFETCDIEKAKGFSFKSIYQLASMFTNYAKLSKDFYSIRSFVINQYDLANQLLKESKEDIVYKMEVTYLIANMYFRVKDFNSSLEYISILKRLNRLNPKYKNLFYKRIICLKALALHFNNQPLLAIDILKEEMNKVKLFNSEDLDIILSAVMMKVQVGLFNEAILLLNKLKHTDNWYTLKMGKDWVLQKHFIEIILNIEMGDIDRVDSRLRSFIKNYSQYFKETGQERVLIFIDLIKQFYHNPEYVTTKEFHIKVEQNIDWKLPEQEDIFVMSCFAWLKSKMFKTNLYETTLDLVRKKSNTE